MKSKEEIARLMCDVYWRKRSMNTDRPVEEMALMPSFVDAKEAWLAALDVAQKELQGAL